MSEWRPIETAPKDGSVVMLYGGSGRFGWSPPGGMTPISFCFWDDNRGHWREATGEQYETDDKPIHWMPLPDPPQSNANP